MIPICVFIIFVCILIFMKENHDQSSYETIKPKRHRINNKHPRFYCKEKVFNKYYRKK